MSDGGPMESLGWLCDAALVDAVWVGRVVVGAVLGVVLGGLLSRAVRP